LEEWAGSSNGRRAVSETILAIAAASAQLNRLIACGPQAGELGAIVGASEDGEGQKVLDVRANALFVEHLRSAPVAAIASEEMPGPVVLRPEAPIAVAFDPLDGSNNVDVAAPMGTLFGLLPVHPPADPAAAFTSAGDRQLAAGFVIYGPYTAMIVTVGQGVQAFALDPATGEFHQTLADLKMPKARREYAINASNRRHWPLPIRAYVEECVAGADGPRGVDYNTRWLGCVVAEAYRILLRGGIYLYPGDARPGYERGRLRLLYEAHPIALLVEHGGGAATDGVRRILDLAPAHLHQRVPLVFGSSDKVNRVRELYEAGVPQAGQRPLFATRGLFQS
jgi:fructose-1,6-bisphosphatase I